MQKIQVENMVKQLLKKVLPPSAIGGLQRLKLNYSLSRRYKRMPFEIGDILPGSFKTTYADLEEKHSPEFKKIMAKMLSFPGAGPIGPNKYWEYPWVIKNLDLRPGMTLLDAGCGRSPIQYFLADLGMRVSGIDPEENVAWHGIDRRLAQKFSLDIDYRVEGMERISYPDEYFDRVASVSVLEHCRAKRVEKEWTVPQSAEDRKLHGKMIHEMARVLKKGGLLVITLDIIFPKNGAILEANIDVKNLIDCAKADGLDLLGFEGPEAYYGYEGFNIHTLEKRPGLDIQNYEGMVGTSLGLVFKKLP
jgi:SAM-dependent methyltransferase